MSDWQKMDAKELERQYSPSRWSKRFPAEEIIEQHVTVCQQLSLLAKKNVQHRLDVPYGDKPKSKLDVFGENLPRNSAIMVYVHGGYWQELDKSLSQYSVESIYKSGILSVIMGYTLAPDIISDNRVEEIVEEVRKGIKWVCDFAKDRGSSGVYLMGWSAGAQLITQVMSSVTERKEIEQFSIVKGLITLSGVYDLRPLVQTYVNLPLHLNKTSAWEVSPLKCVEKLAANFPNLKALITVAENESSEFKRQSLQYFKALQEAGIKCQHEVIKKADHFSLVEGLSCLNNMLTTLVIDFLKNICLT